MNVVMSSAWRIQNNCVLAGTECGMDGDCRLCSIPLLYIDISKDILESMIESLNNCATMGFDQ